MVLLDTPGGTYWHDWLRFVDAELVATRIRVDRTISAWCCVTDDLDTRSARSRLLPQLPLACDSSTVSWSCALLELTGADRDLDDLSPEFADIVVRGAFTPIEATPAERRDDDHVDLARFAFRFDRRNWARLRMLIDRLNGPGAG